MAILSTGNTFGATDTVTSTKLNNIANAATFDDPVDDSTLQLYDGKLRVKANGITFSKLTDVNDDDTMSNASATTLATSESIKAYADSLADITPQSSDNYDLNSIADSGSVNIGGLILKFGNFELASDGEITLTFPTAFPTACLMVMTQDTRGTGPTGGKGLDVPITSKSTTGFTANRYNETDGYVGLTFLAIGY